MEFGLLPHALNQELRHDLSTYKTLEGEGGSLLFGAFCTPFFAAGEPSFFNLRLCAVVWNGVALLVFALIAALTAGPRAAALLSLLWIFAPPMIMHYSGFGWANHLEGTLPMGITLLAVVGALGATGRGRRWALSLLAGLLGMASIHFHLSALPFIGAVGIAVLVAHRRRSGPNVWLFGLGLLAGLLLVLLLDSPVDLFEVAGGWVDVFGQYLAEGTSSPESYSIRGQAAERTRIVTCALDLLRLWWFPAEGKHLLGGLYLAALGGLIICWIFPGRGAGRGLLAGEPPRMTGLGLVTLTAGMAVGIHLLVCIIFDFALDGSLSRYAAPTWPFLLLLCAPAGNLLSLKRKDGQAGLLRPGLVCLFTVCLVGLCAIFQISRIWHDTPAPHPHRQIRGYSYLRHRISGELVSLAPDRLLRRITDQTEDRAELLFLHGRGTFERLMSLHKPAEAAQHLRSTGEQLPEVARSYYWEGVGSALGRMLIQKMSRHGFNRETFRKELAPAPLKEPKGLKGEHVPFGDRLAWLIHNAGSAFAASVVFGFANPGDFMDFGHQDLPILELLSRGLPAQLRIQLCAGWGANMHFGRSLHIPDRLEKIPWCSQRLLFAGVGVAAAREFIGGPPLPPLSWWYRPTSDTEEDAYRLDAATFHCAMKAELRRLGALTQDSWPPSRAPADSWLDCVKP